MSMFALQRVVGWLEKLKIMSTQLLNDLLQSVTGETMLWSIKKEKWITGKVMSIVHKGAFTFDVDKGEGGRGFQNVYTSK